MIHHLLDVQTKNIEEDTNMRMNTYVVQDVRDKKEQSSCSYNTIKHIYSLKL